MCNFCSLLAQWKHTWNFKQNTFIFFTQIMKMLIKFCRCLWYFFWFIAWIKFKFMSSKLKIQRRALFSIIIKRCNRLKKRGTPFRGDIYTYNVKANLKGQSDTFLDFCQLNFTVFINFFWALKFGLYF